MPPTVIKHCSLLTAHCGLIDCGCCAATVLSASACAHWSLTVLMVLTALSVLTVLSASVCAHWSLVWLFWLCPLLIIHCDQAAGAIHGKLAEEMEKLAIAQEVCLLPLHVPLWLPSLFR